MLLRNHLAVIPLREEASDKAEMTSQVLYGETVEVLENTLKWMKVRCTWDGYQGWIAKEHLLSDPGRPTTIIKKEGTINCEDGVDTRISPGSLLTEDELERFVPFHINTDHRSKDELTKLALQYLNTPYLWGGRSCWGIDCSGLIQVCFSMVGHSTPRDAYQQALLGEEIKFEDSREGDVAFFQNEEGKINHVGIVLSENRIIHASGFVRIDGLTKDGITRKMDDELTHRYKSIRRIST